mgnify:CR=1 FL=1
MREEPSNAPIPEEFKASTSYYDQRIADGLKRLGDIQAMTNAEAEAAAKAAHEEALRSRAKYLSDKDVEAGRLNAMLEKVRAWVPPTPDHQEMKKFMIQQITISMPGSYAPSIPVLMDGAAWRKQETDNLAQSVADAKNERAKEIDRTASWNEWLKQLRRSLAA